MNINTTAQDNAKIMSIIARADGLGISKNFLTTYGDLVACHLNGCPLDLDAMLTGGSADFAHDIHGIAGNIDRNTGKLLNCFLPRFAARVVKVTHSGWGVQKDHEGNPITGRATWGARGIDAGGYLDLVPNRQNYCGDEEAMSIVMGSIIEDISTACYNMGWPEEKIVFILEKSGVKVYCRHYGGYYYLTAVLES